MSATSATLAGAVLAGGASSRMGRDKARLRLAGVPLWRRQLRVLQDAGAAPVLLVQRAGQRPPARGVLVVNDRIPGAGPLAGLHAALAATDARWLAVLAVDMPAIDPAWFAWLRTFCRPGVGAAARHAGGSEPLAAIYPREALAVVSARLARGERSLQGLVTVLARGRRLRLVPLPPAERWRVANWNSPGDLVRIRPYDTAPAVDGIAAAAGGAIPAAVRNKSGRNSSRGSA